MLRLSHDHKLHRGYILLLALVSLSIFFTVASAYLTVVTGSAQSARHDLQSAQALAKALLGRLKALEPRLAAG